MSTVAERIIPEDDEFVIKQPNANKKAHIKCIHHERAVLKSQENIFKAKYRCNLALKRKLKKYKLRKDGEEDPDVINVSHSLSTALKIESSVGVNNNIDCNKDEWRFKNYLMKMAKKTEKNGGNGENKKTKCNKKDNSQKNNETSEISEIINKHSGENGHCTVVQISDDENSMNSITASKGTAKETNAFQLMMNARNKSIGSNSPGKEKKTELSEDENIKKQLRLKHKLVLEKMAQSKGSLRNKEVEALKDDVINTKMTQRAKRLKKMLLKKSSNVEDQNTVSLTKNDNVNSSCKLSKRPYQSDVYSENSTKRLKTELIQKDSNQLSDNDNVVIVILEQDLNNDTKIEHGASLKNAKESKSPLCTKIRECDSEFLNKLSPSIRKKESMLSYFGKLEKTTEYENKNEEMQSNIIKVKFTSKRKRRKNMQGKNDDNKLTQDNKVDSPVCNKKDIINFNNKNDNNEEISKNVTLKLDSDDEFLSNKNHKVSTPLKSKLKKPCAELVEKCDQSGRRSKRVSKKPIKYQDCIESPSEISSEDEDNTFTSHDSTKHISNSLINLRKTRELKNNVKGNALPDKKNNKKKNHSKKILNMNDATKDQPSKLAPIFANKNQLSRAELEAKQNFLQSGIPDKLKKIIDRQKRLHLENNDFLTVLHVQQINTSSEDHNPWRLKSIDLNLKSEIDYNLPTLNGLAYEHIIKPEPMRIVHKNQRKMVDVKERLQLVKQTYPKFPVYRVFRTLKTKCSPETNDIQNPLHVHNIVQLQQICDTAFEEPCTKAWTDKFKPTSTSEIIGNFDGVKALKKWLITWKEGNLDGKSQQLSERLDTSDSSDFYYPSDSDSRDSNKSFNNVLIVTGPVGCGKTSAIYAVAAELAMKVIEVNASAKRTGKTILSNLQEATQSHKVNRGANSSENSQNSQEIFAVKNKMKKKKTLRTYSKKCINIEPIADKCIDVLSNSQSSKAENSRTAMSLILIEDADLVFDQDDGFISALNQIVQISKRPVIIVTSSLTCPHLQRFFTNGNIIKFHNLSPKMLGTWLDILCLVENVDVWQNMGNTLLDYCNGDIRKAINILQFWGARETLAITPANEDVVLNKQDSEKLELDDECSTMSWSDKDHNFKEFEKECSNSTKALFSTFLSFSDNDIGLRRSSLLLPVDHLNIWWNIPSIYRFDKIIKCDISTDHLNGNQDNHNNKGPLMALTNLIDNISASDLMFAKTRHPNKVSAISNPWCKNLSDSVSEAVDLSPYHSSRYIGDSISYALLTSSISATHKAFGTSEDTLCVDYTLPGMAQLRSRERVITRHKGLNDGLSLGSHLDRRGLAMDYWSACREICRIEKDKSGHNSKRNNRFCHYLMSTKVSSSSEVLETLCESLSPCSDLAQ